MLVLHVEQEWVAGNTLFKNKNVHKYKWVRQDGIRVVEKAMMDYVVVEKAMMDYMVVSKNVIGRLLGVRFSEGRMTLCLTITWWRES